MLKNIYHRHVRLEHPLAHRQRLISFLIYIIIPIRQVKVASVNMHFERNCEQRGLYRSKIKQILIGYKKTDVNVSVKADGSAFMYFQKYIL